MEKTTFRGSILGGIQHVHPARLSGHHARVEFTPPVIATRRRHSAAFKRRILELIEKPGASVAGVALEHGVNSNLVFKWRRAKLERKRFLLARLRLAQPRMKSSDLNGWTCQEFRLK